MQLWHAISSSALGKGVTANRHYTHTYVGEGEKQTEIHKRELRGRRKKHGYGEG